MLEALFNNLELLSRATVFAMALTKVKRMSNTARFQLSDVLPKNANRAAEGQFLFRRGKEAKHPDLEKELLD